MMTVWKRRSWRSLDHFNTDFSIVRLSHEAEEKEVHPLERRSRQAIRAQAVWFARHAAPLSRLRRLLNLVSMAKTESMHNGPRFSTLDRPAKHQHLPTR